MNKGSRGSQAPNNSSSITKPAYPSGSPEEKRGATNNLDLLSRPSKMPRLNDGISYALPDASVSTSLSGPSTQVSAAAEVSNSDKQASQVILECFCFFLINCRNLRQIILQMKSEFR